MQKSWPPRSDSADAGPGPGPEMIEAAGNAAAFLRVLAHEGRLGVLGRLVDGEREAADFADLPGASVHLDRLRREGWVTIQRRAGTSVYSLVDARVAPMLRSLVALFPARPG